MSTVLGDPDRIRAIAEDFVEHYETRVAGAWPKKAKPCLSVAPWERFGYIKTLSTCDLSGAVMACEEGSTLNKREKTIKPMELSKWLWRVTKMILKSQDLLY